MEEHDKNQKESKLSFTNQSETRSETFFHVFVRFFLSIEHGIFSFALKYKNNNPVKLFVDLYQYVVINSEFSFSREADFKEKVSRTLALNNC